MKKLIYLIVLALILGLVLTGCLLSNVGQVPSSEQSGSTYLTKNGSPPPTDSLVGLWHFDGDVLDSSGNGNNGTVYGTTAYVDSPIPMDRAFSFNGSTCVYVADSGSLDITRATIEAWVKPSVSTQTGSARIVFKGTNSPFKPLYFLAYDSTGRYMRMVVYIGGAAKTAVSTTTLTNTEKWYHIAGTYDGIEVKIYVDGTLEGTTSVSTDGDIDIGTPALGIGRNPEANSYGYKGLIDEVRIWNVALSQDQLGDVTPPVVTITVPAELAEYTLGQTVLADWTATDAESGIASATGTVPSGSQIDTGTVGTKLFEVTATDNAGNITKETVDYYVIYNFSGFFSPVDNHDVVNLVKAGSAIPVKFSLSGNKGLIIFATPDYPKSVNIACDTSAELDEIESTVTVGSSSLNYDAAADQYIYVWKTDKAWANTCRKLEVKLNDGFTHIAYFKFKK